MFCSKCGKQNPDGARFCAACGAEMPTPAPEVAPEAVTEVAPEVAPEAVAEVAPEVSESLNPADEGVAPQPESAPEAGAEEGFNPDQGFPYNYNEIFAQPQPKKKKTGVIVLCIVLAVAIVAGALAAAYFINAPVISDDEIEGEWVMEVGLDYLFNENLEENGDKLSAAEKKVIRFYSSIDSDATIKLTYNFKPKSDKVTLSMDENDIKQAYEVFFDDLSAYIKEVGLYKFAEESGMLTNVDVYDLRQYYNDNQIIIMIIKTLRDGVNQTSFDNDLLSEDGYFGVKKDRLYFSDDKDDIYEDGCWLISYNGKDVITVENSKDFDGVSLDGSKLVRVD